MLHVQDLSTVLDTDAGQIAAVEALSLSIERGETFALVGESGCGKSMTALSILRLLPDNGRVVRGRIALAGVDLAQLPESKMRDVRGRSVSIIFQEPATSLNPVLTVGDQIIEVIERHTGLQGAAARAKAIDWLQRVGLPEPERRIDGYPFQLSGGQKQRVMIAIALAAEPQVLVADEPTTALDVTVQKQILDLLADLQRQQGLALLLITHDLGVVAQMAQRVALMYAGQIVEVAEAAEFFARPLHPYARMLIAALPDTAKRGERLAAIGGSVPALDRAFPGCRFAERCPYAMPVCHERPPALAAPRGAPRHFVRCVLHEDGVADLPPLAGEAFLPSAALAPVSAHDAGGAKLALGEAPPPISGGGTEGEVRPASLASAPLPIGAAVAPLLEVRDYRVYFPIRAGLLKRTIGYVRAVDGVGFSLAAGRTLALVGESGCGKTTIGKGILQLLRGTARIDGQVALEGRRLDQLQDDQLRAARRKAQIIFQDPFASLNPRLRVAAILEEGMAALRPEIDAAGRRRRVAALIEHVGLRADALGRYPHEFSGGQRQRLAIARALAVEPKLIVCDEPTSALDVSVQAQILNLLAQLQRELGVAYLFITHNFGVVKYLADDIAVMRSGVIVEAGPAEQVLTSPQAEYTASLLAAVPRLRRT